MASADRVPQEFDKVVYTDVHGKEGSTYITNTPRFGMDAMLAPPLGCDGNFSVSIRYDPAGGPNTWRFPPPKQY